jgi:hypothetical protein
MISLSARVRRGFRRLGIAIAVPLAWIIAGFMRGNNRDNTECR